MTYRWDGIIECITCGFHILVPEGIAELSCPSCGIIYEPSDDMGWFDYQIYRFTPKRLI